MPPAHTPRGASTSFCGAFFFQPLFVGNVALQMRLWHVAFVSLDQKMLTKRKNRMKNSVLLSAPTNILHERPSYSESQIFGKETKNKMVGGDSAQLVCAHHSNQTGHSVYIRSCLSFQKKKCCGCIKTAASMLN